MRTKISSSDLNSINSNRERKKEVEEEESGGGGGGEGREEGPEGHARSLDVPSHRGCRSNKEHMTYYRKIE